MSGLDKKQLKRELFNQFVLDVMPMLLPRDEQQPLRPSFRQTDATPTHNVGEFILPRGKATGIEFKVLKHRGKTASSETYHIQPYPLVDLPSPIPE